MSPKNEIAPFSLCPTWFLKIVPSSGHYPQQKNSPRFLLAHKNVKMSPSTVQPLTNIWFEKVQFICASAKKYSVQSLSIASKDMIFINYASPLVIVQSFLPSKLLKYFQLFSLTFISSFNNEQQKWRSAFLPRSFSPTMLQQSMLPTNRFAFELKLYGSPSGKVKQSI